MRTADDLADRRFDNAEASARLAELSRSIAEQEGDLAQLRKQRKLLSQEGIQLDVSWRDLWGRAPFVPLTPDAMLEWLDSRNTLLESIETRNHAESACEVQRQSERESKQSLLAELSSLGTDCTELGSERLPVILILAEKELGRHRQRAQAKNQMEENLEKSQAKTGLLGRTLTRAMQAQSAWQQKFTAALTHLGLAIDSDPDDVSARIDVIDQMREVKVRIDDLRHSRIDKINRDIAEFGQVVEKMTDKLAGDLAGKPPDDVVVELENRLEAAQRNRQLRLNKEKEIEATNKAVRNAEEALKAARGSVNHLKATASANTTGELRSAIERSDTFRVLQHKLDAVLRTLKQEGDGLTVSELEAECSSIDIDRIVTQDDAADDKLNTLHGRLSTAAEVRSQARNTFQSIDGNDAAAQAEALRQEALADLRQVSERYVRVQTSAMLLQWAIERFRQEKQGPLLRRAGELFATITQDSFKGLRIDYDANDKAQLTGVRHSGEIVSVSGLSSGTADQLYLALRVASIEDYLNHADALPFLADDLFINFDTDRAGASFEVLGELSRKTQVVFFTHHAHLLDIARERLGASIPAVELN